MTDNLRPPYCWICQSPAAVHVQGTSYVCQDHWDGTGGHYLQGGHIE